ncbi:pilus assembly protein PilW [Hylemonella gracilis str. Niagara R]|uniref:Pilus assembly protein PilW n=1 Tax=Hylemonella gracilis str. Niagara R TaxID=1458275 RepID=A0A016XI54_9BURK|nr:type IV pilus biogenesis/stability protein PilW [Hylemonella gracilis]EYC51247.1 pilus assembly protein PilW [Hylemonella gracilis str. Niagara R]
MSGFDRRAPRARIASRSLWAWTTVLMLVVALPGLQGCAQGASSEDLVTASDEPEQRRRARLRLQLALGYYERGQSTVALDETKQALAIDPGFIDAHNLRGLIYMQLEEPRLAQESFRRALALNDDNPDVWHNLAWLQCQQGEYAQATRSFERALAQPAHAARGKTWLTLGLCQMRARQADLAERSLLKAHELDPGNPVTGYNLAQLLYARGALQDARFYIQRINNNGALANAETLWLGAKIEHRLGHAQARDRLGSQLRAYHPGSKELDSYDRRAFDE